MTTGKQFRAAFLADVALDNAAEVALLDQACATLDEINRLERRLAKDGTIVKGARGQPLANPVIAALRSHREAFARMLSRITPANDPGQITRSQAGKNLANTRWRKS